MFWSIKNSGEVLNKLKSRGFRATSLSTYDFSTLYTTLPHNLIKEKLINLIEWTFKREGSPYIACNERHAFFTSEDAKRYKLWSCQNVCEALIYLLDNIYVTVGALLYGEGRCVYDGGLLALTPIRCCSPIEVYNASGTGLFLVS